MNGYYPEIHIACAEKFIGFAAFLLNSFPYQWILHPWRGSELFIQKTPVPEVGLWSITYGVGVGMPRESKSVFIIEFLSTEVKFPYS